VKTLTAGMQSHVASGSQKLAWALQITRTDGEVFRYVSASRGATLAGDVYVPAPGFTVSSMTCTLGYSVDTLTLTVLTDTDLEQADFLVGRWYGARVEFNQYNWSDPTDGFIPWPTYRVADVRRVIGGFELELRDLRQLLRQDYTLTTGKLCENRLGDARCQVDVAGEFTYSFTVTSVTSRLVFTDSALGLDANWCIGGVVTFDDGLYEGLPLLVREQSAGGQITLAEGDRLVTPIDVGQTGTITAGCRKRLNLDCRDKFDNVINFLGAKHSPSDNDLAGGASV
jgi:uncharacterized phage protein (TIGR02218 family)